MIRNLLENPANTQEVKRLLPSPELCMKCHKEIGNIKVLFYWKKFHSDDAQDFEPIYREDANSELKIFLGIGHSLQTTNGLSGYGKDLISYYPAPMANELDEILPKNIFDRYELVIKFSKSEKVWIVEYVDFRAMSDGKYELSYFSLGDTDYSMTWNGNKASARMLMVLWLLSHGFSKSELNITIL